MIAVDGGIRIMPRNTACTVYIGNLDDKVNEKVLYEVLIQVGHLVDLYIPRDKENNHHKGYAFAEYETKEIAEYAVRLFSGLVRLHNRTLKFAMSGQDMPFKHQDFLHQPKPNSALPKPHLVNAQDTEMSNGSPRSIVNRRVREGTHSSNSGPSGSARGLVTKGLNKSTFGYSRRVFGTLLNNVSCPGNHPVAHASC